ncbi:BACON domain-containing protein [Aquimarina pacifica]|uniref:BACON domain-containing protein n=1 Tax=Aquimarina pacifica TaxID=1296415 RepID=UPI00046E77E7|nr:BACON domain-containing carbohydrate-binding protein [Aquimarina pacifica]
MKTHFNEFRGSHHMAANSSLLKLVNAQTLLFLTFLFFITPKTANATDYTISSDDEFNDLSLSAGDVVTWANGTYSDQSINFINASGTASNPIILKAETPGGVIFTGESRLFFAGDYLIVNGFYWNGGEGASDHISFRRNGSDSDFGNNCTIRNCAFNNLYTEEPGKSRWIVLYGTNNIVENCSFVNKLSAGACILVELAYQGTTIPAHTIRSNYFYNITPKDTFSTNSGDCEAIRIGVSEFQAISAQVTVENNYFKEADGENEIITNKSADNIFKNNTFRNCRGSLVLRHGSGALVDSNFFLGEGKAKSGGIRVTDRDHVIINNYMQDLSNDGDVWNNAITLVGGGESSGGSGNGYQNVDNVLIAFNTIYNSDDPIHYNDRNSYDPTGVIAYNLVYGATGTDLITGDISGTGSGIEYVGNIMGGSTIGVTSGGITEAIETFTANGEIVKPISTGIAANAGGNDYAATVNTDIEGRTRPNSNMDVGAHEVSGGTGNVIYSPITDNQVGDNIGSCFLDASGNTLSTCGDTGTSDILLVSSASDFSADEETQTINITSNLSWNASDDSSWISITPTSGSNDGSISITVSENTSTSDRSGEITVTGGSLTRTINITQLGVEDATEILTISSPTDFSANGGTQTLSITSNLDWTLSENSSWLSTSTTNGSNNATVNIIASENTSSSSRNATVTVSGGDITRSFTVTQEAASNSSLAPSSILPDLAYFKITYPLDINGDDYEGVEYNDREDPDIKAHEVRDLVDYVPSTPFSEYFYVEGNEVVFKAHCAGALSSANAYPRSELRETIDGNDEFWSFDDEQELNATFRVTHLPNIKQEVCMLQIKGDSSEEVFRLEYRADDDDELLHVTINEDDNQDDYQNIMDYSLNDVIKARMYINDGRVYIELDNLNVSGPNGEWNYDFDSAYGGGYFKAGAYTQSSIWEEKNKAGDEEPDAYGEVRFSELRLGTSVPEDYLELSSAINFSSNEESKTTTVTSNVEWTVSENNSWISVDTNSGSGNGSITITTAENLETSERSGLITVSGAGITKTITVTQAGFTIPGLCTEGTNLSLTASIANFSDEENSTNTVTNILDGNPGNRWSAEGFPQYAVIDLGSDYNINEINLTPYENRAYQFTVEGSSVSATSDFFTLIDASDNTSGGDVINRTFPEQSARYVKLTITGASGYTGSWSSIIDFEILCAGATQTDNLTVSDVSEFPETGETQTVTVTSNVDWTVSENSSWVSVNTNSGSNNGSIEITVDENTSTNTRTADITVEGGDITRTITITQAAATIDDILTVSAVSEFSADGETQTVTITSNIDWTVSENSSWVSVNTDSGSNNGSIEITVDENTSTNERTADITVEGGDITRTITITQAAAIIDDILTVSAISEFSADGDTQTVTITSNIDWTVSENGSWVSVNTDSGSNNGSIEITVDENTSTNARTADITVEGGDITRNITITQAGINISEGCTEGTNLSSSGSIIDFSNEQNSEHTVDNILDGDPDNRWSAEGFPQYAVIDLGDTYNVNEINLYPYSDRAYQFLVEGSLNSATSGFETLTDATDNTDDDSIINRSFTSQTVRYIKLTITGASGYTGSWSSISDFQVICSGIIVPEEVLEVSSISDFSSEGENQEVTVTSNLSWTITDSTNWISTTLTSGSENGSFDIVVEENTEANERTGTVTISGGNLTRTINITQDAAELNSNCTEGSNLAINGVIVDYSDEQNSEHTVDNIIDENPDNRWSASGFPQYAVIDLGDLYNVNEINLYPYSDRAYQFLVEGSQNSSTSGFVTLTDATSNTEGGSIINRSFAPQSMRYIKLTITGASGYTGSWSSISDFEILCSGITASSNPILEESTASIKSYPNPTNSFINIEIEGYSDAREIQIFSTLGQLLHTSKIESRINTIDVSQFKTGIYLIDIKGKKNLPIIKFSKK